MLPICRRSRETLSLNEYKRIKHEKMKATFLNSTVARLACLGAQTSLDRLNQLVELSR